MIKIKLEKNQLLILYLYKNDTEIILNMLNENNKNINVIRITVFLY